jgi:hypothetical protein
MPARPRPTGAALLPETLSAGAIVLRSHALTPRPVETGASAPPSHAGAPFAIDLLANVTVRRIGCLSQPPQPQAFGR